MPVLSEGMNLPLVYKKEPACTTLTQPTPSNATLYPIIEVTDEGDTQSAFDGPILV
jgi:hypothetical protein